MKIGPSQITYLCLTKLSTEDYGHFSANLTAYSYFTINEKLTILVSEDGIAKITDSLVRGLSDKCGVTFIVLPGATLFGANLAEIYQDDHKTVFDK